MKAIGSLWLSAALTLTSVALCSPAEVQQHKHIRIGYLAGTSSAPAQYNINAFRQGLLSLGYIEGRNIEIEYRYAEGKLDRAPTLIAELVQLKVDVLVTTTLGGTQAAKQATKTIPIVTVFAVDPVATGIIDSLARPGGNITGVATLQRDLSGKRLELLREVVPRLSRVGVIWDANAPGSAIAFKEYEAAAQAYNIQLQSVEVRGPQPDIESAFQAATKGRVNAVITIRNPLLRRSTKRIAELALMNRLPSMYEGSESAEGGGLMSYSAIDSENYRRAAVFVDKILKGAKPSELPVEQPTKFELVINLKTANQIGLTIPAHVLARADRVIR